MDFGGGWGIWKTTTPTKNDRVKPDEVWTLSTPQLHAGVGRYLALGDTGFITV